MLDESAVETVVCFANARLPDTDYRVAFAQTTSKFNVRLALPEKPHCLPESKYVELAVGEGFSLRALASLLKIPLILRRHRARYALFFATQFCLAGPALARMVGVTPVMTVTGLGRAFDSRRLRWLYVLAMRVSARLSQTVLFQNSQDMGRLMDVLPEASRAKCHVVGSGIDAGYFGPSETTRIPHRCLMVARLIPEKGIDDLLALADELAGKVDFVLVGPASSGAESLLERVRAAATSGRIQYVGPVASSEVREELRRCGVLLLPSRSEGLPRVALEAALSGCAVVGYDIAGTRAALGPDYELVRPGALDGLRDMLVRAVEDAGFRERLVQVAGRYVGETGTSEAYVRRLETLLR